MTPSEADSYAGLVVVVGHFATLNAEELLRDVPGIDAVVRFGGEAAPVALLQRGLDDDVGRVPGLVWRARDGGLRHGAAPALDVLPRTFTDDDDAPPLHLPDCLITTPTLAALEWTSGSVELTVSPEALQRVRALIAEPPAPSTRARSAVARFKKSTPGE